MKPIYKRKFLRLLLIGITMLALGTTLAYFLQQRDRLNAPALKDATALRERFNADAGKLRLIAIVSPT